jgi:membrane glycosyltransferase
MFNIAEELAPAPAAAGRWRVILHRRVLFAALVVATMTGLLWLLATALSAGGLDAIDILLLALFAITLPWTVIGFWNATIGLLVMRFAADPVAAVIPAVTRVRGDEAITASVAILAFIRNEMPARVVRNLAPMLEGLAGSDAHGRFHLYVLRDTNDGAIAAAEELTFGELANTWRDRIPITYRRRAENAGFKAGNLGDFCRRWGDRHDLAVTLDADSFIPADAILRMVRVMQAAPEIGILQGLVVGMPSTSAFARIFQFGMRLGMRSYTIGSAWWQGDCGPHWGHNSVLRVKPFDAHCQIAPLPGEGPLAGHVLSHDQIEAVLMRRAGYEVRVLPEENLGWEENPPTLLEFIRRDLRWCQGNMQYWRFLFLPGLKPVSRYQLAFALLMFLGSPAWIGLLVFGSLGVARAPSPDVFMHRGAGFALLVVILIMWFAPKIATTIDVLTRPALRAAFGGGWRFVANVAIETAFFLLLSPIMWFGHTAFLGGLLFGRSIGWAGQTRDDHAVPLALAARRLWPQMLLGWTVIAGLAATVPSAIPYALLVAAGLALSAPLAAVTADRGVGMMLARLGIGRLPEEGTPTALDTLGLPALKPVSALPAAATAEASPCSQA